jgi:hypothetical protein
MARNGRNRADEDWSPMRPHEEFLELCAVSTSGELSEEEQKRLRDHLAACPDCRKALQEFEAVAEMGVPFLSSELSPVAEPKETSPRETDARETGEGPGEVMEPGTSPERTARFAYTHGNSRSHAQMNWKYVWMTLAAAVLLAAALGMYLYQFGKQKGQEVIPVAASPADPRLEALEQQMSDAGHEREVLNAQLTQRDGMIAELRRQLAGQSAVLAEARSTQASLERSLQKDESEKQQAAHERNNELRDLLQKLDAAQGSLQKTQAELDTLRQQRLQDQARSESLEAQLRDLHGLLRDREQAVDKQEELLARDRDIRDLMGARDLYIAEVYDVGRDGATQKPYGRVFYTKGKSLVFYAYDLDQQPGVKNTSTFQAWGRGGPDRQQVQSLGIFYQDSAAKKRWALKFDDPRRLEQLDAIFVTVEPAGGSQKPSSRPLLFASLRIQANHP